MLEAAPQPIHVSIFARTRGDSTGLRTSTRLFPCPGVYAWVVRSNRLDSPVHRALRLPLGKQRIPQQPRRERPG